ncbi:bacterial transcriptional activator domain-containing protein [Sorangium sp. So ce764]|uniref:tetratricopeptide repeat protein n=1 Tax=Sorangium sp. So ce764 TaxID=3133320 RepID=UPI003F6173CE
MPRGALPKIPCCSRPRGLAAALAAVSLSLAPASGEAGEPGPAQSDTAQTSPNLGQLNLGQLNLGQAKPNPGRLNPGQPSPNPGQPNLGQPSPNPGQLNPGRLNLGQASPNPGQPGGHKEQVLALYQAATRLLEAGRVAEACAMLEQGRTLDPTALNLLLRLGECLARTGRTAGAWNVFSETAAIAKSAGDPRAARAAALAAALEPRLSRMAIAVPPGSAAPGLEIRRNGVLLLPSQWGQALPVDPGTHTIEAQAPGRKRWSVERVVPPDGAGVVIIDVPLLLAQEPPPRALAAAPKGQRTQAPPVPPIDERGGGAGAGRAQRLIALATGGAGLVGLGLGAVFGAEAIARRDASNRGHCDARSRCDAVGVSLREDAQKAGTASTIAFSTGTAALLAAGLLLWTAPPSAAGPPSRRATAAAAAGPGGFSLVVGGSY